MVSNNIFPHEHAAPTNFKSIWQLSGICFFLRRYVQWWFVNQDTFVPGRYFRINEFSELLNHPSVQKKKSVPAFFVRISKIFGLSEPGLMNHHCCQVIMTGRVCECITKLQKSFFCQVAGKYTIFFLHVYHSESDIVNTSKHLTSLYFTFLCNWKSVNVTEMYIPAYSYKFYIVNQKDPTTLTK